MSEDDDQTWQHGFDPGQDDPYEQGHEGDALSAVAQENEEIVVPPGKPGKTKPAKKQKSSNDKKQTMIIIGVAVAAAVGWIGYGMLEGKPVNPANGGMVPAAPLQPARAPGLSVPLRAATATRKGPSRSMLDTTAGVSPASTYTTSPARQIPSSPSSQVGTGDVPPPATAAPSAIPVMGSSSALPMPMPMTGAAVSAAAVSAATTSVPASPKTIVPTRMTTPGADRSRPASSVIVADLKNQIAQLKSRIAQESLQLSAEKSAATAAPALAPKVIYRVIYRHVPAARPSRPAHAAPRSSRSSSSAVSIPGIRVIGAAQGTAWLSVQGHRMMVQVGDDVPGLGVVQSISDSGIVHGSHGTAQP
jgi:hypothetical protein